MKRIRTTTQEIEGTFEDLFTGAETGDVIVLYEGDFHEWTCHPQGVLIRIQNQFLLNGAELLWKGERWDGSWSHPEGMVVKIGEQFLLNGTTPINHNDPDIWYRTAESPVTHERGGFFHKNGTELLYDGKVDGWGLHPSGLIIQNRNKFSLIVVKSTG